MQHGVAHNNAKAIVDGRLTLVSRMRLRTHGTLRLNGFQDRLLSGNIAFQWKAR